MDHEIDLLRDIKSIAYFIEHSTDRRSVSLKLSDFFFRTKRLENIISVSETQKPIIERLLNRDLGLVDKKYLAGSRVSAVRKGLEVLNKIKEKGINLENYGFINLGGGNGTELFTELMYSKVNYGILMEYDFESVNQFSDKQVSFYLENSNRSDLKTDVIECDLLDREKMKVAKTLIREKKLNGIVVTIHAVLHELSKRSPYKFDMEVLFKRIYELHDNIIFIIREPGIAENWPEEVYISVGDEHRKRFAEIVEDINARHFNGTPDNFEPFEDGTIRCIKDLAVEALTKLFYDEDYDYEKREQITSVSMGKITKALHASGFKKIDPEPFYTDSLKTNFDHFNVEFKGKDQETLPKPQCFTYTIASKGIHTPVPESTTS